MATPTRSTANSTKTCAFSSLSPSRCPRSRRWLRRPRSQRRYASSGFTPTEAIRIATLNGAQYLKRADRVGSIAKGKRADLLIVRGDPGSRIADIENAHLVFKDGVAYDAQRLFDSARGTVGLH